MNPTITAFDPRQRLEQRARELAAEIAAATGVPVHELPHEVLDQRDDAATQALEAVEGAGAERDLVELRDVRRALARLDDGSYGLCQDCGEPIGAARLAAQPAALRCIGCQRTAEGHHA